MAKLQRCKEHLCFNGVTRTCVACRTAFTPVKPSHYMWHYNYLCYDCAEKDGLTIALLGGLNAPDRANGL